MFPKVAALAVLAVLATCSTKEPRLRVALLDPSSSLRKDVLPRNIADADSAFFDLRPGDCIIAGLADEQLLRDGFRVRECYNPPGKRVPCLARRRIIFMPLSEKGRYQERRDGHKRHPARGPQDRNYEV